MIRMTLLVSGLASGILLSFAGRQTPESTGHETARLRRPVALVESAHGRFVFVANARTGSVSVLDISHRRRCAEIAVGRALADVVGTPDGRFLLAVDPKANEVIILSCQGKSLKIRQRLAVSRAPVTVCVSADGGRATVASLWAWRLSVVDVNADGHGRLARVIDLPFAPRMHCLVHDRAIVADAFGGRLAVVNLRSGMVESCRDLPAQNIRGLALDPDGRTLWLTHQVLHPRAETTVDDIHWGNVITNHVRRLCIAAVLSPKADILQTSQLYDLGDVGHGAADPNGVIVRPDGTAAVAVGGTGELAIGKPDTADWIRLAAGKQPTAVVLAHDGAHGFVINTLSDSVSVVDLSRRKIEPEIALGPPANLGPADRGEVLFHDARLGHEQWFTCHSCHPDGHTTGGMNDNRTDGSYGTPKRVLSLLGVADTPPYAWNGQAPNLQAQIRTSLRTTMRGPALSKREVADLEVYLRTLPPPPPVSHDLDRRAINRGRQVFEEQHCSRCHQPPTYTSARSYDVGLTDEAGNRTYNPPSLRGVSQGRRFFHDGRATTLEEVVTRYRHELRHPLNGQEVKNLLAFLRSL